MVFSEEERRFNWIQLYCNAMRWAITNEVTNGQHSRVIHIQDLIRATVDWWITTLQQEGELRNWVLTRRSQGCVFCPQMTSDFRYLYDLECDLWGANWQTFLKCRRPTDQVVLLEPFRMVTLFYLVERSLKLLMSHFKAVDYEHAALSHGRLRQAAFVGLYVKYQLARWFPFPFNLAALTARVKSGSIDCDRHRSYGFIGNHFSVVGKQHYVDVLESALCQATRWQRKRHTDKKHRPKRGSIQGFFFDVLWHYSESYRYHIPLASAYTRQNPFYWGLDTRWVSTVFVTIVELWLYTVSARKMQDTWDICCQSAIPSTFHDIQKCRWQYIQNQRPQTLV